MTSFTRVSTLVALSFVLPGVAGCQEDNEATVRSQQSATADPKIPPPVQPKSQLDAYKQQQQNSPYSKGSGYPGARK